MAGVNVCVNFTGVALSVGSWKTVCAVATPAERMLRVKSFAIFTDGTDGAAKPIEYRLVRATSATGTSTAATAFKLNNALGSTPVTVGSVNYTVEPTYGGGAIDEATPQFYRGLFHPQGGVIREVTFDDAYVEEGTMLALQAKIASAQSGANATGHIVVEE